MLLRMQKLAKALLPLKSVWLVLIFVFGAAFALNIFGIDPIAKDVYLIPILIGLLWSLLLYSFVGLFQEIPATASPKESFVQRFKARFRRGLYWLLGLFTVVVSISVVVVTIRLFGVWE